MGEQLVEFLEEIMAVENLASIMEAYTTCLFLIKLMIMKIIRTGILIVQNIIAPCNYNYSFEMHNIFCLIDTIFLQSSGIKSSPKIMNVMYLSLIRLYPKVLHQDTPMIHFLMPLIAEKTLFMSYPFLEIIFSSQLHLLAVIKVLDPKCLYSCHLLRSTWMVSYKT